MGIDSQQLCWMRQSEMGEMSVVVSPISTTKPVRLLVAYN